MAHPFNRTFSFSNDDELALSSNEQERLAHHNAELQQSPSRDNRVSPPLRYTSPPSPIQRKPISPPLVPQPASHAPRFHPSAHPDSAYNRIRGQRQSSGDEIQAQLPQPTDLSDHSPPRPPPHAAHRRVPSNEPAADGRVWGRELGYTPSARTESTATPGMDNLGATAAGGGIAGIAYGIANTNERESGSDAQRAMENTGQAPFRGPPEREFPIDSSDNPYVPQPPPPPQLSEPARSLRQSDSYSSTIPLGAAAATPGHATPTPSTPGQPRSERGSSRGELGPTGYMGGGGMYDDPYQRRSQWVNPGAINPDDIADDGDDGFTPSPKRRSMLSLNRNSSHDVLPGATAGTAGVTGGAVAGGVLGTLGGLMHRQPKGATASGVYGPVPAAGEEGAAEKSEWLRRQTTGNRKMRLWVGILIGAAVIAAIVGAIVGGVLGSRKSGGGAGGGSNSSSQGESASEDDGHGDLDKNSAEIKKLLNNPKLHKVFPGMDYTPFNAQYPACLTNPPSQNNVTRDIAVLSQLTNTIRTYGTDCNQTAMVVHAFDKLEISHMKLWIGVWVDKNDTTTNRQLEAMYDQVENGPGQSYFKGVIVGNEALFNGFTEPELGVILEGVRSNFTSKNVDLPLATSDLGSNWTPALAELVDVVMSNVHPFFAGVTSVAAAGWTWQFWQDNDVVLTKGMANKKQIIAEVGWPSGGGNDCGTSVPTCPTTTAGSVAGIDEMNTFMSDWVCQSMANGTDYFWFEAFDEPWKVMYNKPGKSWEDKWGLMDPGRNLKPGLTIPDCGGQTVS